MSLYNEILLGDSALSTMDASFWAGASSVPTARNLAMYEKQANPKPSCDKCLWIAGGVIAIWILSR